MPQLQKCSQIEDTCPNYKDVPKLKTPAQIKKKCAQIEDTCPNYKNVPKLKTEVYILPNSVSLIDGYFWGLT